MSRMEFSELTQTVTTLPYDERVALLEALEQSIKNEQEVVDQRICALDGIFGIYLRPMKQKRYAKTRSTH